MVHCISAAGATVTRSSCRILSRKQRQCYHRLGTTANIALTDETGEDKVKPTTLPWLVLAAAFNNDHILDDFVNVHVQLLQVPAYCPTVVAKACL